MNFEKNSFQIICQSNNKCNCYSQEITNHNVVFVLNSNQNFSLEIPVKKCSAFEKNSFKKLNNKWNVFFKIFFDSKENLHTFSEKNENNNFKYIENFLNEEEKFLYLDLSNTRLIKNENFLLSGENIFLEKKYINKINQNIDFLLQDKNLSFSLKESLFLKILKNNDDFLNLDRNIFDSDSEKFLSDKELTWENFEKLNLQLLKQYFTKDEINLNYFHNEEVLADKNSYLLEKLKNNFVFEFSSVKKKFRNFTSYMSNLRTRIDDYIWTEKIEEFKNNSRYLNSFLQIIDSETEFFVDGKLATRKEYYNYLKNNPEQINVENNNSSFRHAISYLTTKLGFKRNNFVSEWITQNKERFHEEIKTTTSFDRESNRKAVFIETNKKEKPIEKIQKEINMIDLQLFKNLERLNADYDLNNLLKTIYSKKQSQQQVLTYEQLKSFKTEYLPQMTDNDWLHLDATDNFKIINFLFEPQISLKGEEIIYYLDKWTQTYLRHKEELKNFLSDNSPSWKETLADNVNDELKKKGLLNLISESLNLTLSPIFAVALNWVSTKVIDKIYTPASEKRLSDLQKEAFKQKQEFIKIRKTTLDKFKKKNYLNKKF